MSLENFHLQNDIKRKNFKMLCQKLREGDMENIDHETWTLLADYLEGNIKAKRGPKYNQDKDSLNRETQSFYQELKKAGTTRELAIHIMARHYEDEEGQSNDGFIDYEHVVRNRLQQYQKTEKKIEEENVEKWKYILERNKIPKTKKENF